MFRSRTRGFTLVDLLVVIAIIAVLIAILLPALGRAKKVAKTARCLANVRALTSTLNLYMADRQANLPYGGAGTDNFWTLVLREYGNSNKLSACPEASDDTNTAGSGTIIQGTVSRSWVVGHSDTRRISVGAYGVNGWLQNAAPAPNNFWQIQTSTGTPSYPAPTASNFWKFPFLGGALASIPVMTDACWPDAWPLEDSAPPTDLTSGVGSANSDMMRRFILNRHNKAVNVGFADNHAETVPLTKMWSLKWHKKWTASTPPRSPAFPLK
jgi:prepilin-type N-terminal cleavage/methylation domain-containing protein/prepilin-type processing-associated H-X9-DG protein